eukprot:gene14649-10475_t
MAQHVIVNANESEEFVESRQWTAVYPLPSLSTFTKRILKNRRKQSEPPVLDGQFCTTSPSLAARQAAELSSPSMFSGAGCWLCAARDLPDWHFRHRHVKGGYRQCRTFFEAFWSIFQWHNESINIWSHLLGSLLLVRKVIITAQALYGIAFDDTIGGSDALISSQRVAIGDTLSTNDLQMFLWFLILCMVLGSVVPIGSSAFCHTFYGLSPSWHRWCWFIDFVGLMFGVLGITTGYLGIAFLCPEQAAWFYVGMMVSVIGFGVFLQRCYRRFVPRLTVPVLTPNDRFPEFAANMSQYSAVNFALATVLTLTLCPQYFETPALRSVLTSVALFPVSLVLSLVVFAQGGVPERFSFWWSLPDGFFDFVGHSHQWWHVASCSILYLWLDVVHMHFAGRWQAGCPA